MSAHLSVQLVGHIQVLGSVGAGDAPGGGASLFLGLISPLGPQLPRNHPL